MKFVNMGGAEIETNMFPASIRGGDRVHVRLVNGLERDVVVHTCLGNWLTPQFDSLGYEAADVAEVRMLLPER